ncbi:DUF1343 domain-containing protein [soil metagenome]
MAKSLLLLITCCLTAYSLIAQEEIVVGAGRFDLYLPKLKEKNVGLVVNQTSLVNDTHLVDTLLSRDVAIKAIFAPEHGYSGKVERGETISDSKDISTGIPIISIYGSKKKPATEDLKGIQVMIFDMQDVGSRFFTYISTLHYIMEACAENNIPLLVLDRPNPLGHYVDGPILDPKFKSFIGMHPIPIVHGLTIGEYAQMINGQGWLNNGVKCELEIIKLKNYDHHTFYEVPVDPSPNLPDMKSVYLYPSICLFEGTKVNEGRGTYKPFQQFGTPTFTSGNHQFTPKPIPGLSADPKFNGKVCYGYDLSKISLEELQKTKEINLFYLLEFYRNSNEKDKFFEPSFDLLAGSDQLRKQIISGKTEQEIKASWQQGLAHFKETRRKYLLYEE